MKLSEMDSLDTVEIVMAIEEVLGIEIPGSTRFESLSEIVDRLGSRPLKSPAEHRSSGTTQKDRKGSATTVNSLKASTGRGGVNKSLRLFANGSGISITATASPSVHIFTISAASIASAPSSALYSRCFRYRSNENAPACFATCRHDAREHPRHSPRILLELRKLLPQECLFVADHRQIDGEEHHDQNHAHPPTPRRHGEADADQQRSEVQRIPRVSVRPGGRQRLVLAHVSGSQRANQKPRHNHDRAQRDRIATWAAPARSTARQTRIPAAPGCGARSLTIQCSTTQPCDSLSSRESIRQQACAPRPRQHRR